MFSIAKPVNGSPTLCSTEDINTKKSFANAGPATQSNRQSIGECEFDNDKHVGEEGKERGSRAQVKIKMWQILHFALALVTL